MGIVTLIYTLQTRIERCAIRLRFARTRPVADGDKMMVTHLYFDPSPAKIARLFRRVKQNNRRIARKANR
jgi:hypothetical protein